MFFQSARHFADRLAVRFPVLIQAPMAGGITTPELVANVTNAGGIGSFATGYLSQERAYQGIKQVKELTDKPFAANLFIPQDAKFEVDKHKAYQALINDYQRELGIEPGSLTTPPDYTEASLDSMVEVMLDQNVSIVSFTFGMLPSKHIKALQANNTCVIGTANSLQEAQMLAYKGVDAITVQGLEAGGHMGGFATPFYAGATNLLNLLPEVVRQVTVPVIAAGGIMDGCSIASAIRLGACGVQMGTAFLTTDESGANPVYRQALQQCQQASKDPTVMTKAFSGKYARGLNNKFIRDVANKIGEDQVPEYPLPHYASKKMRAEAAAQGRDDRMSLWAGQGVTKIQKPQPAANLVETLLQEADQELQQFSAAKEQS